MDEALAAMRASLTLLLAVVELTRAIEARRLRRHPCSDSNSSLKAETAI